MTIESHPMGGVKLSGEDARAFVRWVESGVVSPAAVESLRRGRIMAEQFNRHGKVSFTIECEQDDIAPGEALARCLLNEKK